MCVSGKVIVMDRALDRSPLSKVPDIFNHKAPAIRLVSAGCQHEISHILCLVIRGQSFGSVSTDIFFICSL